MNPASLDSLLARIQSARNVGELFLAARAIDPHKPATLPAQLDALTATLGLQPIGNGWREIDETAARAILQRTLEKDFPAGRRRLMPARDAAGFIDELWADLPAPRRHFTNAKFAGRAMQLVDWNPITYATFDTGVISVSGDQLTLLWAGEDD